MPAPPKTKVDLLFRAFADPVRLRLLHVVQAGEMCVGDLVAAVELPQPTVSRHLSYLRKAGLVRTRNVQSWSFYRLAPATSSLHRKLLACLGTCLHDVPELAADAARAKRLRAAGGCCPSSAGSAC
jgi:ArsR family transcriptional regulator, arsenate/arsenite/antimonite-responsive transcriptional repressor